MTEGPGQGYLGPPQRRDGSKFTPGTLRAVRFLIATALAALVASCGGDSGPPAPDPGPVQTICMAEFCIDYPSEWQIEVGEDFVVLSHPDGATASVGRIDMRGVVEGAGEFWPASPENTMEAFWALLDDLGSADLDAMSSPAEGIVDSDGQLDGRHLWHRLLVVDAPRAWGAELRADNTTWSTHAAIITGSLRSPDV